MADLKTYSYISNGIPVTVKLTPDDAKRLGAKPVTVTARNPAAAVATPPAEPVHPDVKARTVDNAARNVPNKGR